MINDFDLDEAARLTRELVTEMGQVAKDRFGATQAQSKADGSIVTEADRMVERIIRQRLELKCPDHAVFGEEDGLGGPADSPYLWLIDPIDGTNNFACGLPLWGVSLGLFHEGKPCQGALCMPCLGQTFWAARGQGAYCNGKRLSVRRGEELSPNDLLMVSAPDIGYWDYSVPVKYRTTGCAAYSMALVAAGCAVGMVSNHWHFWDAGATMSLLSEAGAVMADVHGKSLYDLNQWDYTTAGPFMIVASPEYHRLLAAHARAE